MKSKKLFSLSVLAIASLLASCGVNSSVKDSEGASQKDSQVSSVEESTLIYTEGISSDVVSDESSSQKITTVTPVENPTYDLDELKSRYGAFSITYDTTNEQAGYTFDEATKTYTLAVGTSKITYSIKGYFEGHIVIADTNNLGKGNYKGAVMSLEGACLVTNDSTAAIDYSLSKKNVEVKPKKDTSNLILSLGDANAVESSNNIELDGKGKLDIFTVAGHGFKTSDDFRLYGEPSVTIYSGHDGIHCGHFYTDDAATDTEVTHFSGKCNLINIAHQAIEASSDTNFDGTINISGGTFFVNSALAVFKSNLSVSVLTNATVDGYNITEGAVLKDLTGTNDLTLTVEGHFYCNGQAVESAIL